MSETKLCLGTAQFGLNYGINNQNGKPPEHQSFAIIDEALKHGITAIDTAAAYGTAEELLGEYGISSHKVQVISKLRADLITDNCQDPEVILEEQIRASLTRTGLTAFDGYLLHSPENFYNKRVITGLRLCKKKGLIRHFGVSIYDTEHALDVVRSGLVDYIQIPYNVLDQRLEQTDFFALAKQNRVTVFARSAFLQGLILMSTDKIPDYLAMAKKYLYEFDRISAKYGFTRIQAAFLFVYTHPGINYLVFGVDNLEQLQEYIALSRCQFDFANCRLELSNTFRNVNKNIICPNLWKKGGAS